jgi:UPF0042 nucleotide-binding protein
LAIGIDTRSSGFEPDILWNLFHELSVNRALEIRFLYLDCDNDVLLRRFTETRRRHPLDDISLPEALDRERHIMNPLKSLAELVIDTSRLSTAKLGQIVRQHFSLEDSLDILIQILSFSYRGGLPRESDMIFDARFLSNPYYEMPFRALTGKDKEVGHYLSHDTNWQSVYRAIQSIIKQSLKGFRATGRSYLTIACGCTGGQHRSVFLAEHLFHRLLGEGESVIVDHRDMPSSANNQGVKT